MTDVVMIPTRLAAEAYVAERAELCREILAEGIEALRPRPAPEAPRRQRSVGEVCYRCPQQHVITEPDHQPVWPLQPTLSGLPAMPLDSWTADTKAMREFEAYLDALLDRQAGDWLEAAE